MVSSSIDIPPLKKISLLSNSNSLNLGPVIASKTQPLPLPPVRLISVTSSISKSWGSTKTSSTDPSKIGSTKAVSPIPILKPLLSLTIESSTITLGGFKTSYPDPPLKRSNFVIGP